MTKIAVLSTIQESRPEDFQIIFELNQLAIFTTLKKLANYHQRS
jgi:hypothetical protein